MSEPTLETSPSPPTALTDALRRSRAPLLVGHERPDGDCLGSQAALARVLARLGKDVRILNPDAAERHLAFLLDGLEAGVHTGGALPAHDLWVLIDGSELSRCGPLAEPLTKAGAPRLVIDHHLHSGVPWWDEAYLDPGASATGLLVWRLAHALEVLVDAPTADALLTALVTDTGWFRYPNTDAPTLLAASKLVELGGDPARLVRELEGGRPIRHPFALATLLESTEYLGAGRLAVLSGSASPDADTDAGAGDEALAILRRVQGVEVVLYFRVSAPGRVKLSARSEHDFDVRALAARFGGGGHLRAAGATIEGELGEVRAQVTSAALEELELKSSGRSGEGGRA